MSGPQTGRNGIEVGAGRPRDTRPGFRPQSRCQSSATGRMPDARAHFPAAAGSGENVSIRDRARPSPMRRKPSARQADRTPRGRRLSAAAEPCRRGPGRSRPRHGAGPGASRGAHCRNSRCRWAETAAVHHGRHRHGTDGAQILTVGADRRATEAAALGIDLVHRRPARIAVGAILQVLGRSSLSDEPEEGGGKEEAGTGHGLLRRRRSSDRSDGRSDP
ncbi:hypothetical protein MSPGM_30510 [Methylorubrum sp. GM97]|nr:hypothetical protein MSPGM_30510 [Methylorubrum sp. GM97]